jgi:colanic acid biosynthesis glycosyl transferase WcaI
LLLKIARRNLDIEILVIANGSGYLKLKQNLALPKNIKLIPLQPFNKLNLILNSADVLFAMINKDASKFSVPSKILNYFCAGKPIILSAPKDNLASKMLIKSKAGKVFEPDNFKKLNNFLQLLKMDKILKNRLSVNGRKFAEKNFKIENIALKFQKIFNEKL